MQYEKRNLKASRKIINMEAPTKGKYKVDLFGKEAIIDIDKKLLCIEGKCTKIPNPGELILFLYTMGHKVEKA